MRGLGKLVLALLLASAVSGCSGGDKGIPTASVTGEVKKMNGEPVGDVMVVFYPEKGPSAVARADAGGKFTATVPLGQNRVAVIANSSATSDDTSPEALAKLAKEKPPINVRFSTPDTSGLAVEVKPKQEDKVVLVVD